jgi:hypothetical protein
VNTFLLVSSRREPTDQELEDYRVVMTLTESGLIEVHKDNVGSPIRSGMTAKSFDTVARANGWEVERR